MLGVRCALLNVTFPREQCRKGLSCCCWAGEDGQVLQNTGAAVPPSAAWCKLEWLRLSAAKRVSCPVSAAVCVACSPFQLGCPFCLPSCAFLSQLSYVVLSPAWLAVGRQRRRRHGQRRRRCRRLPWRACARSRACSWSRGTGTSTGPRWGAWAGTGAVRTMLMQSKHGAPAGLPLPGAHTGLNRSPAEAQQPHRYPALLQTYSSRPLPLAPHRCVAGAGQR